MKAIIVAGPPSAGKTAVIMHAARRLLKGGESVAAVKFDTRSSLDPELYAASLGIPVIGGISDYLCPDHYFISNMEEALDWGRKADCLFIETAGLCLRCAPHIEGVLAVTVVDSLGGTHVPQKMGPMLSLADIVALTKGDLVSQAEREVIAFGIRAVNPQARILPLNGLLGTGILGLISELQRLPELSATEARTLRHDMPAAICSYCTGEKRIGRRYQSGNVQKLQYKAT